MATRFDCCIPGFWHCVWLRMRHPNDWHEKVRGVVTDRQTGYRFKVTEEEDELMGYASDAAGEMPLSEVFVSGRQAKRALELMADELFLAMYQSRHGDDSALERFLDMTQDELRTWWANIEAKARVAL